jgi:hypothetical protein
VMAAATRAYEEQVDHAISTSPGNQIGDTVVIVAGSFMQPRTPLSISNAVS